MIMGATHDIKILDFSVFFWQLLDNFCWKLLHWTKTWSEANEWANNWWELLDPMIAKLALGRARTLAKLCVHRKM